MEEARQELHRIINDREMKDSLLLVFANKQDLKEGRQSSPPFAPLSFFFLFFFFFSSSVLDVSLREIFKLDVCEANLAPSGL